MKRQNLQTPMVFIALPFGVHAEEVIDYSFKPVGGKYRGQREVSYLVPLELCSRARGRQIEALRSTGHRFEQESILYVDEYRTCYLIRCVDGHADVIGKWTNVRKDEAERADGYTYDPQTLTYWVVK